MPKPGQCTAPVCNRANLSGVQFDGGASFVDATFGRDANFDNAKFGDYVSFSEAKFGDQPQFSGATFGAVTIFHRARFGLLAQFVNAHFGEAAVFVNTQFGDGACFDGADFGPDAMFMVQRYPQVQDFRYQFGRNIDYSLYRPEPKTHEDILGAFVGISFQGTRFSGDVSFQGRDFAGATNFANAQFGGIPGFHGCTLHQDTSFDLAVFNGPPSREMARAYRTLKLAFAGQQALREEQRFFRLEMKTEARIVEKGVGKRARKGMFWLYEKLSDYGFSLWRPICLWAVALIDFGLVYGLIADGLPTSMGFNWSRIDGMRTRQWVQFTLINSMPLPGFDRTLMELRHELFGPVPVVATLAEVLHKTVSLLALFLSGLALRNLFKMKG